MKKILLMLVVICLLGLSVPLTGAQSIAPVEMAQYFPANTELFFAMRTDEGFIEELDAILADIMVKVPQEFGIPPVSLSMLIEQALAEENTSRAEIRTWLGDSFAFGATDLTILADGDSSNDDTAIFTVALAINDAAAFEEFLLNMPDSEMGEAARTEQDGYIIYTAPPEEDMSATLAIGSDVVLLNVNTDELPYGLANTLDSNEDFSTMTDALLAPSYNMIGYIDLQAFFAGAMEGADASDIESLLALGFDPASVGGFSFGLTILDGRSFTIDLAQSTASQLIDFESLATIDANFANNIPAGTDLLIHGTNLSAIVGGLLDTFSRVTPEGEPDPTAQIEQGINAIGLDLQEDILSWTKGDFALYLDADLDTIINAVMTGDMGFDTLPITSSLLLEATDKAAADRLAASLGNTLTALTAEEESVTVSEDTIGDAPVTVISSVVPTGGMMLPVELVLGANSEAFFLGTRDAVEFMAADGDSLGSDPDFIDASQYFLPDPYLVLYTNDEGFMEFTVLPLALLGSSIDNIFEEIIDGLETSSTGSTRLYVQDEMGQILAGFQAFKDIFASSSITASAADGIIRTRINMTIDR